MGETTANVAGKNFYNKNECLALNVAFVSDNTCLDN